MKTIWDKGETYKAQCEVIRHRVSMFGQAHGCEPIPRGRHGHASLLCNLGRFTGIIDIQMELIDWNKMPDDIPPEYPFELWCSADKAPDLYSLTNVFWELPFCEVEKNLDHFLEVCWDFLTNLKDTDFTDALPETSVSPDRGPNLGGPKPRTFMKANSAIALKLAFDVNPHSRHRHGRPELGSDVVEDFG
jgi:hypothetical protein